MAIRVSKPTVADLERLALQQADNGLTYAPVGMTASADAPPGYRLDRWSRNLGSGRQVFERAAAALRSWEMHRAAGLIVFGHGAPAAGDIVAMAAPLPVGFVEVVCRVVAVEDGPKRYTFTYGTTSLHPEQGEELFAVELADDGSVDFTIVAISRARHPLARLAPPIARRLQRHATNRYLDGLERLARG